MEQELQSTEHRHYWKIAQANGPTSAGVCKHCGENREFRNWLTETDFMGREELTGASSPNAFSASKPANAAY